MSGMWVPCSSGILPPGSGVAPRCPNPLSQAFLYGVPSREDQQGQCWQSQWQTRFQGLREGKQLGEVTGAWE